MEVRRVVTISKKRFKDMKKEMKKYGSYRLLGKYGEITNVRKSKKRYYEVETGRRILCLNDVLKKIDKEGIKTSHGNTYVADIERESIKNGLSIDERVEKIDDAIMSTATDILSSFFNKRYGRA